MFRYAGTDVSNIELKGADTSTRDLAVQLSKNVRLARFTHEVHVGLRMPKPSALMGDVSGKMA